MSIYMVYKLDLACQCISTYGQSNDIMISSIVLRKMFSTILMNMYFGGRFSVFCLPVEKVCL